MEIPNLRDIAKESLQAERLRAATRSRIILSLAYSETPLIKILREAARASADARDCVATRLLLRLGVFLIQGAAHDR